MHRVEEKGSKLGGIMGFLMLALGALIVYELVPVISSTSKLHDFMVDQAKIANRTKPERIEKNILEKAKSLDLPLSKKGLEVSLAGGRIRMRAQYTVPVEFPLYTYKWDFDQKVDRPVFRF